MASAGLGAEGGPGGREAESLLAFQRPIKAGKFTSFTETTWIIRSGIRNQIRIVFYMKCRAVDLKTRKEEVNQGLDLDLLLSLVMSGAYVC